MNNNEEIAKSIQTTAQALFDSIRHKNNNVEYWEARELSEVLGYVRWESFENVIAKAKVSIKNAGGVVDNHFRDITKMVEIGSNTVRPIKDVMLSRFACYIISQNGDPTKNEIALAQSYFAQQTRLQETEKQNEKDIERLEARHKLTISDKQLSSIIINRGVNSRGLAMIKSEGDKRLFGGKSTQDMKKKYQIKGSKPLADHLPTISLTAKQLANEMTTINTENKKLYGPSGIGNEHLNNNTEIRNSLVKRGIKIENLPPEEDIKDVAKRIKISGKNSGSIDE